jgi:hypothetical protein
VFGQVLARDARALAVVGADEGNLQAALGHHGGVELVVNVDDDDAGVQSSLAGRDERLRVRRGDDHRVHALGDHLLDEFDLAAHVQLVLDAARDQFVIGGVRLLVVARALLHRLEELVGE